MKLQNTWSFILAFTLFTFLTQAQKPGATANSSAEDAYKGMKWRNIGPYRGGRSVTVTGMLKDPMTYIAGYTGGGLWKTTNGGMSWKNISDGFFKTGTVGAIAVSEYDPNVIYVGMGEHPVRGVMTSPGDGMYKSTDAGKTWKHIGLPKSYHIARIRIHPKDPDIVWVAVQGAVYGANKERGVYKTTDGGTTWRQVLAVDENTGACELSLDASNPRVLYAAMWQHRRYPWLAESGEPGSGLYKSTDSGETWTKLTKGLPEQVGKAAIAVSAANPDVVYANIETDREKAGVYRSDDAGMSWRITSKDPATISRSWYYMEIFPDPKDENTVYVLNAPALRSTDGGKTFTAMRVGHGDTHDLWINPNNPDNMILADDGGAEITFNGGEDWSTQNNQPTAQFYRVITDNRFPYYVYGGQQDNSTVAIQNRTSRGGIDVTDWYSVGGGESAFIAFDPNDPKLVYAGSYQGNIDIYNVETGDAKDIMAYPSIGLAITPSTMKYRFNWNAPIVAQPQNPKIIYHGANHVLRTADGGITWTEISPDLTRNDKTKQIDGGGPYTNEGAGGEVYNTISYIACSPHKAGVIWVGSDDGLVHVTQDEGKTWSNVTPPNLGETLINAIEVSPHNPSAAYVVATRYKFNDFTPVIFYTSDFGKSWTKITNGIEAPDFVRVVREDKVKPGLLYAGCERGMYISFDNGKNWQKFQLNLPVVPVTDLTIHDNDLIAATQGRAFWILDDLSAIQQSMGKFGNEALVYQPSTTVRFNSGGRFRPNGALGENPPNGVIIGYYLPEDMDSTALTMEIIDASGRTIRTYSSQPDKKFKKYNGGPSPESTFAAKKGVNRFNWDLHTESIPGVDGVYVNGSYEGAPVAPGTYKIRLTTPKGTSEQTVKVVPDPRINVPEEAYIEQQRVMEQININVADLHKSVTRMREIKTQIENLTAALPKDDADAKALIDLGKETVKKINDWEAQVIQTKHANGQDVINFYNRLNAEMLNLKSRMDAVNPTVTAGAKTKLAELVAEWGQRKQEMVQLLDGNISKFNQLYKEKAFPAITIPKPSKP